VKKGLKKINIDYTCKMIVTFLLFLDGEIFFTK